MASRFGAGAGTAFAGTPGYYVSGEGGVSLLPDLHVNDTPVAKQSDSFGTGFAAGGAVGYDTGEGVRVELKRSISTPIQAVSMARQSTVI